MANKQYKHVCAEIESMGLTWMSINNRGATYTTADGFRVQVSFMISDRDARHVIHNTQKYLGLPTNKDAKKRKAQQVKDRAARARLTVHIDEVTEFVGSPEVYTVGGEPEFDRLMFSPHAVSRFRWMQEQAGLTPDEVAEAYNNPKRVEFDYKHNCYRWVAGRVIVPIATGPDRVGIVKTVGWSSHDLYERFPRPEVTHA